MIGIHRIDSKINMAAITIAHAGQSSLLFKSFGFVMVASYSYFSYWGDFINMVTMEEKKMPKMATGLMYFQQISQ